MCAVRHLNSALLFFVFINFHVRNAHCVHEYTQKIIHELLLILWMKMEARWRERERWETMSPKGEIAKGKKCERKRDEHTKIFTAVVLKVLFLVLCNDSIISSLIIPNVSYTAAKLQFKGEMRSCSGYNARPFLWWPNDTIGFKVDATTKLLYSGLYFTRLDVHAIDKNTAHLSHRFQLALKQNGRIS